jgi:hypothetical protein
MDLESRYPVKSVSERQIPVDSTRAVLLFHNAAASTADLADFPLLVQLTGTFDLAQWPRCKSFRVYMQLLWSPVADNRQDRKSA